MSVPFQHERANPIVGEIEIVDHGRGPQLSTSRVTVQDLVPYFQAEYSHGEILRWIPSLTREELVAAEEYYRRHQKLLDEKDRKVREHRVQQVRLQQAKLPESNEAMPERLERLRRILSERNQEQNGAGHTG